MRSELGHWFRGLACCAALTLCPALARADGPTVGKPAPPLTVTTLDGRSLSTDSLRGQVVVLSFWATWCTPCRAELPVLSAYAAQHAQDGLVVLGISLDDPGNVAEVRKIAQTLSFPVAILGSEWAGKYGRIWKMPANFTIDRAGLLADNAWNDAQPDWTQARLESIITPLLAKPQ
jgi:cytochrome c biogenesis protein CcmG, thiol:disulfide interchange protein DsbE